ncbi:alpha/beta fold hydrolase [Salicola sp. Rm-C-2C1-2]|uniref:alpha/beta fold hydrolase n=1 Tax=Salicola sp. Rm-C-2C1-2 TaxID=3141321 RepID=UPI0032E4DC64
MTPSRYIESNGLTLCVEERGDPEGPPLLLIMGLGAQMTLWPEPMLERYARQGYRVIRYDNRDIGLSSLIDAPVNGHPLAAMARFRLGLTTEAPYTLHDHARDAAGLMDALGIDSAHVKGVSMGGMTAQLLAATHPRRVRSLALVMTSNNSPRMPMPRADVLWWLQGGGIRGHDEEAAVARGLGLWKRIQSPSYPRDLVATEQHIRADYRRSYRPQGILRQMRGILATGDLSGFSRRIRTPTLILHGTADPLIRPQAARRLHRLVPGARLHWIRGMGHDMPDELIDRMVDQVCSLVRETDLTE